MAKTLRRSQDLDPNPITLSPPKTTAILPTTRKSVSLHDWWLVKAEANGLAVGGLSRGTLGPRVFCSAGIAKRHNATTLETMDGITITISGFINKSRTCSNGFPLEVCNHFLIGFPYYWTEYATRPYAEDSAKGVPNANTSLPDSLVDLPVTRIRDLMMSPLGDSEKYALTKSIFDNLLSKCGGKAFGHSSDSVHLNMENRSPIKKVKTDQKYRGDDGILDAADTRAEQFQKSCGQSKMGLNVFTPVRGVATRSMTRLNNLRSKPQENLSSSCTVKPKISARTLTIKATRNLSGGLVTRCALNESHARQDKEVIEASDKSPVRRSSGRMKNLKYSTLNGMG